MKKQQQYRITENDKSYSVIVKDFNGVYTFIQKDIWGNMRKLKPSEGYSKIIRACIKNGRKNKLDLFA